MRKQSKAKTVTQHCISRLLNPLLQDKNAIELVKYLFEMICYDRKSLDIPLMQPLSGKVLRNPKCPFPARPWIAEPTQANFNGNQTADYERYSEAAIGLAHISYFEQ